MKKVTFGKAFPWRQSYEPFRGNVWEIGLYRIQKENKGQVYVAYHGGQRIFTSANLYEAQLACEGRLGANYGQGRP